MLCQGRGSAANSIICYCLGITDVGPEIIDTLFERFISKERNEPPDIDVDFEHERRDVVIAYIYEKYSGKRTALAASVVTYRGRSALREVAKAMGLSDDVMTALSSSIWGWSTKKLGDKEADAAGLDKTDQLTSHVLDQANEILEFPRHLSQHVGGFVITRDRLDEIVPIIKTAMPERKMVEWDKDDLDVDRPHQGRRAGARHAVVPAPRLRSARSQLPAPLAAETGARDDPAGGEGGLRHDLPRRHARRLPDRESRPDEHAAAAEAEKILRPCHRSGDRPARADPGRHGASLSAPPAGKGKSRNTQSPELEKILSKTLGVPLFQEQAMRIAIEAGGFTPGEADQLRRAMATFKRNGTIGNYRQRMIDGMVAARL